MGRDVNANEIILLFDNYSLESQSLHTSFRMAGKDYPVVVIDDDGFLPDDVISVFGFFLGDFKEREEVPGKPRYFNQITVPEYWEISGTNSSGKVNDLSKERGRIFYAEPVYKRLVKVVDWYDEKGVVRSSDHYNRYGALYARTIFNAKGQKVNKSYFSASGQEIIVENYVTRDIILNDGDEVKIFRSKTEFVLYFLEKAGMKQSRIFFNSLSVPFFVSQHMDIGEKNDVLFWQEPVKDEIPGNMMIILEGKSTRTATIKVQKRNAYNRLLELGASKDMVHKLGFVYPYRKNNFHKPEALICTNSDRIEQCNTLVEGLPDMHFHIAALTEMSSKLMGMEKYDNVTLYPGVKREILDELFEQCDYYFDVNHEGEIVSAVRQAFLHNHLIFAFDNTIHNKDYVADEHIYAVAQVEQMIADVKAVLMDSGLAKQHLTIQQEAALAEHRETFLEI